MRGLCFGLRKLGRPNFGFSIIFFIGWCASTSSLTAQSNPLADTIWDGNAEIIVPKLIWKNERPKFNRVETVSTIKFQVPIQLWFWGANDNPANAMCVCFNARKVGADPLRAELTMPIGQLPSWAITQLQQIHARRPRKDDSIYLFSGNYGRYNFSSRTKKATFQLRNVDESTESADPTIDWRIEGSISTAANRISKATFVFTRPTSLSRIDSYPVRPGDENLISFQGNITGTILNLAKSSSKPSDQAAAQFSKFFDLQDQSP